MLRINAAGAMSAVVAALVAGLGKVSQRLRDRPHLVMSEMLAGMEGPKLARLLELTAVSNNSSTRLLALTRTIFDTAFDELEEVSVQVSKSREVCVGYAELLMLARYGDELGNLSWASLSRDVATTMTTRAIAAAAAAAAAAPAGHGLGV